MVILAIDPDPRGGTWVELRHDATIVYHERNSPIDEIASIIPDADRVIVEDVQSYGMPVGRSIFSTVKNIGHMRAVALQHRVKFDDSIARPAVKARLCGSVRAKDGNVRQAVIDLYPSTGGGKVPEIGTKSKPGPLYSIAADEWAALALGVVWLSRQGLGPLAERDRA
jgi:hypothetical protein